jgi:gliding motility-associated-like protein
MFKNILFLLLSLPLLLSGQRDYLICREDDRQLEYSFCFNACLLCDLDGYSHTNTATVMAGVSDCSTDVGNWIAFVAMTENISIEVSVTGYTRRTSEPAGTERVWGDFYWLELTSGSCDTPIFEIRTFSSLIDCEAVQGEVPPQRVFLGNSKVFTNNRPLTVGRIYYFFVTTVAQYFGEYSLKVVSGSTALPELVDIDIAGPQTVCQGANERYTINNPIPLARYTYALNGDVLNTTDSLSISWDTPGVYDLCVTGVHPCSDVITRCSTITVIAPQQIDSTVFLCPDECFLITASDSLCNEGTYLRSTTDADGCVLNRVYNVIEIQPDTTRLSVSICSGDTLSYLGTKYSSPGSYPSLLTNQYGCDSLVILALSLQSCPLTTSSGYSNPVCFLETNGSISFSTSSGSPPFNYIAIRLGTNLALTETISNPSEIITLDGLAAGTYVISIEDRFGSGGVITTELTSPPGLTSTADLSFFGTYNVRCDDGADGSISLGITGGVAPYNVFWRNYPGNAPFRSSLGKGAYYFDITDLAGCLTTDSVLLRAPPPLRLAIDVTDEACEGPETGEITVSAISGGVAPYSLAVFSEGGVEVLPPYQSLSAGSYLLNIRDANNCLEDTLVRLLAPQRPQLSIIASTRYLELGDSLDLSTSESEDVVARRWTGMGGIRCDTCQSTILYPTDSGVVFLAGSSSDGCTVQDSVSILLASIYNNYFPSAFSPNGDGVNDIFRPYSGRAGNLLVSLIIYDRWGGEVYKITNTTLPMLPSNGWDGNIKNRAAPTGVYGWSATISHIDGHVQGFSGVLNLVR